MVTAEDKNMTSDEKAAKNRSKSTLSFRERANMLNRRSTFNYEQYNLDFKRFHYHWANVSGEAGSNVDVYEKVGYDICREKDQKPITRKGQSLGMSQILMRIPIEEYQAIQHYKLDEAREIEKSIGKKNIPGLDEEHMYGSVTTTSEVIK